MNNLQPKTKNLQPTSYNLQANSGFTLLEVIISISILTTGVIATIALMNSGLQQISYLKNKIIAINLAQEGIELVRNVRDNNWLTKDPADSTKLANKGFNAWTNTEISVCQQTGPCIYKIDYNDTKLSTFTGDDNLLKVDLNGFYQHDVSSTNSIFKRTITITDIQDTNTLKTTSVRVESEVSFGVQGKSVKLETILYDWK